jgi:hypothetical protein
MGSDEIIEKINKIDQWPDHLLDETRFQQDRY